MRHVRRALAVAAAVCAAAAAPADPARVPQRLHGADRA